MSSLSCNEVLQPRNMEVGCFKDNQVSEPPDIIQIKHSSVDRHPQPEMPKGDAESPVEAEEDPEGHAKNTNNAKPPETSKDNINVREKKGQATDADTLAERVRREKIKERMKLLQDLVPGCSKESRTAEVLDGVIRYVLSLHSQVELASKDKEKEPLLGSSETQSSLYKDVEEADSTGNDDAQNKNKVVDTQKLGIADKSKDAKPNLGSFETEKSHIIKIEKDSNIGDHETHGKKKASENRKVALEWIFVITNFILELPALAFDQLSSAHKPQYALVAMLISVVAIIMCTVEFVYKVREEKVTWKCRGKFPWLHPSSESQKPLVAFKDIIGPVCALGQFVVTTINYVVSHQHADKPIKVSVWPVLFAFGLLCSKLMEQLCRKTKS